MKWLVGVGKPQDARDSPRVVAAPDGFTIQHLIAPRVKSVLGIKQPCNVSVVGNHILGASKDLLGNVLAQINLAKPRVAAR